MGTTDKNFNLTGNFSGKIEIIYSDDCLLAVDKPAGLPVLPDGYHPDAPHLKSVLEPEFGRLWIVHRLDRETSGVMLLARTPETHRNLNTKFEQRQVIKCYHVLACGAPEWQEKTVDLRLLPDGDRRHRTVVNARQGKPSETEFLVLERLGEFTLLKATPHTGRTHQIRAHLAAIHLPILGDTLYGGRSMLTLSALNPGSTAGIFTEELPLIQRCALHAFSLDLTHPISEQALHLEAPYPEDFSAALRILAIPRKSI